MLFFIRCVLNNTRNYFLFTDPNGIIIPASVINTKHGTHRIEYQPFEIGTYKVEVLHHGNTISTKPFLVEICDPSRVKVVDVEDGIIGREQIFKGTKILCL